MCFSVSVYACEFVCVRMPANELLHDFVIEKDAFMACLPKILHIIDILHSKLSSLKETTPYRLDQPFKILTHRFLRTSNLKNLKLTIQTIPTTSYLNAKFSLKIRKKHFTSRLTSSQPSCKPPSSLILSSSVTLLCCLLLFVGTEFRDLD